MHAHVGRAEQHRAQQHTREQHVLPRPRQRPAEPPGKERSSIAIRPTHRRLLFPIRRSLFRGRARRYFPRVPRASTRSPRVHSSLSLSRARARVALYSRDRNEIGEQWIERVSRGEAIGVIILIGLWIRFCESLLCDRVGISLRFSQWFSLSRRRIVV